MVNTRKRARKEDDPVKFEEKRPKLPIEKKNKTKVKVESDQSLSPTTTLNALTVQQPFASAIIYGNEQSKRKSAYHVTNEIPWASPISRLRWKEAPSEEELMSKAGQIIGLAHFTESCPTSEISDDNVWKNAESCNNRVYAWSIDKVVALEKPIPHTGQLGLWKVKEDIAKNLIKLME
ncbi:hypothetical protein NQZ79_g2033 [Umbelopsis isabellina]|nr:hypothetical protein NQZ79_g2033 [Umbelopsis isabellina]